MSETAFPVNDLLRRKLQTGLTLISLTACVAATLFLLLLSDQISSGIVTSAQNILTVGFLLIFNQFLFFVGILVFAVGAVIVSFIVFLMMSQRTRDFGLMKATGCPNGLIFGYFFTELLSVTAIGCILGIVLGFAADYAVINMGSFQLYQKAPNIWFAPIVFAAFFAFALIFGAKPMFDTSRMSPVKAMSPMQYFGLNKGNKFKALSKSRLTLNLAARSLFRRQSATIRIVIFLSLVFTLLTVSIAGSIIARDTTTSWVENATGKDTVLIAHKDISAQYLALLAKFSGTNQNTSDFNYLDSKFALSEEVLQQLNLMPEVETVDSRLVYYGSIQEVSSYTFDPGTLATIPVGGHREGTALIVGVDPRKVTSTWFVDGQFLSANATLAAVVGDTTAQIMYSPNSDEKIQVSDPLQQGVRLQNATFDIVGVCIDPINNGNVIYVPLAKLENLVAFSSPNVLIVKLDASLNHEAAIAQLQSNIANIAADLTVVDLNTISQSNMDFLGSTWSAIFLLPLFCLIAAAFSLIAFLVVAIEEQHHEFAVLRAIGMKPKTVIAILGAQSLIVLLSSFAVGISIGTIITLIILMREPIVTTFTILQISGWLLSALAVMFLVSLYPAVKFAKKPLLKIMS
jgi:ABC-type antimicrobial peptide transport system permease subunit